MVKTVRTLNTSEVHQIGGRAGRFGLSKTGLITATTKHHLNIIQQLYDGKPETLTHARVAPTVDDLNLIPGDTGRATISMGGIRIDTG